MAVFSIAGFDSVFSYFEVASSTAVVYDWVLTWDQEFELVWRQRCSLMSIIYLSMRYIGIIYFVVSILSILPAVSFTDKGCAIVALIEGRTFIIINVMLGVIMITRLHAMYQQSRKMLIFLIVTFLAIMIASVMIVVVQTSRMTWDEVVISGGYHCTGKGGDTHVIAESWILSTVWEVLALCLAAWIAVKHFLELRRSSRGRMIEDCFAVLIKTHVVYFAAFATVSFFNIGLLSPKISYSSIFGFEIYNGTLRIVSLVQMFVLGPRLILSVRAYHAKLTADSDEGTGMTTMAFQEHILVLSTRGDV